MWPQYTLLFLMTLSLGITIKNGEFAITLISQTVVVWLLYMGGFFKGMGM